MKKRISALLLALCLVLSSLPAALAVTAETEDLVEGSGHYTLTVSGREVTLDCAFEAPIRSARQVVVSLLYADPALMSGEDTVVLTAPIPARQTLRWTLKGDCDAQVMVLEPNAVAANGETVNLAHFFMDILCSGGSYTLRDQLAEEKAAFQESLEQQAQEQQALKDEIVSSGGEAGYQMVLEHNREVRSAFRPVYAWEVAPEVQALSDEICAGCRTDMDKLKAIHKWVCENIYYDDPVFEGREDASLPVHDGMTAAEKLYAYTWPDTAEGVLERRRAVCAGYAALVSGLLMAQRIPCLHVSGYGLQGAGMWQTTEVLGQSGLSHAWNEAWVDGRWVILDATWDSGNHYFGDGNWAEGPMRMDYFDPTPEDFARDHRLHASGATPPSTWAQGEITEGMLELFFTREQLRDFTTDIDRESFCELMVHIVEQCTGQSISACLAQRGLSLANPFPDTENEKILAAYALGLVKGRVGTYRGKEGQLYFDPRGKITRQEAAIMLANCARLLGVESGRGTDFADRADIASWAADSVSYVSGLWDGRKAVMGDAGGGTFAPLGSYTTEQALLSALRLYHAAK